jgi:hypothetical protein
MPKSATRPERTISRLCQYVAFPGFPQLTALRIRQFPLGDWSFIGIIAQE